MQNPNQPPMGQPLPQAPAPYPPIFPPNAKLQVVMSAAGEAAGRVIAEMVSAALEEGTLSPSDAMESVVGHATEYARLLERENQRNQKTHDILALRSLQELGLLTRGHLQGLDHDTIREAGLTTEDIEDLPLAGTGAGPLLTTPGPGATPKVVPSATIPFPKGKKGGGKNGKA